MDTTLLIGLFAAFFTTFAFIPQSIKTLYTRNTQGISIAMYFMYLTGVVAWIVYGVKKGDIAVLVANVVTLMLAMPILIMALLARKRTERAGDPSARRP